MEKLGVMIIFENQLDYYGSIDNPWFKAVDIAKMLDYSNGDTHHILEFVEEEDKNKLRISDPNPKRGQPEVYFISEMGFYDICMRSNRPKARQISKEVRRLLVILRKGGYLKTFKTFSEVMNEFEERVAEEEGWVNDPEYIG